MKISIAIALTLIAMLAGGYVWEKGLQADEHTILAEADDSLNARIIVGGLESDIQHIELEMKMYRTISERRDLTPDEQDRVGYLKELRTILLTEQKKRLT